jgi:hypothetical protein
MKFEPQFDAVNTNVAALLLTAESEDERGKLAGLLARLQASGGVFAVVQIPQPTGEAS